MDGGSAADAEGAGDAPSASDTAGNRSPEAVDLGGAGNYVILAKTGISTVPTSAVTGDLGLSPAAATYITGFSLTADATNVFSTSPQVVGKVYAADYAAPTPSNLTTAIGDMQLAFTDAAGRAPSVTELGAGNIGGMTIAPGVYRWSTGLVVPTSVTLAGSATDVWVFQVAQGLTVSSDTTVTLSGGALPRNVFWQVAGLVTLGTTAHFEGVILAQTSISLATGASINGRLLAQTHISIDDSAVVEPAP
jgi:hypothetical protein